MNQNTCHQMIGSLLLQPQKLQDADEVSPIADLANDVLSLLSRLGPDSGLDVKLLEVFGDAMTDVATQMLEQAGGNLETARQRLQAWVQPMTQFFHDLTTTLPDAEGAELAAQVVEQVYTKLAELAQNLTINSLRQRVSELLDVMENELGLTSTFIEEQIWAFIDGIVARLETVPPELNERARATWISMASILRRLKRHLQGVFAFPVLNAEQIANDLFELLGRSGIAQLAKQTACVAQGIADTVRAGGKLIDLVPLSGFAAGTVGAAATAPQVDEKYCWYASWLLQNKPKGLWSYFPLANSLYSQSDVPRKPAWFYVPIVSLGWSNEVWITKERDKVRWGEYVLHTGTDVTWEDALRYNRDGKKIRSCSDWVHPCDDNEEDKVFHTLFGYTFGEKLTPEFMEKFAYYSSLSCDYTVAILHLIPYLSLKEGDLAANILNAIVKTGEGTFKIGYDAPWGWWLEHVKQVPAGGRIFINETAFSTLATTGGALEGAHWGATGGNWFLFQVTQWLSDGIKTGQYRLGMGIVRDFLLSLLTLINHTGPVRLEPPLDSPVQPFWEAEVKDTRPDNRLEVDGFVDPLVSLMVSLILIKNIPREDYAHPFKTAEETLELFLLWGLLGGIGIGLAFGFLWTTLAEIIAWAEDWPLLGKKMLDSVGKAADPIRFLVAYYLGKEGDTDDGRYNPRGVAFNGYPNHESSPYLLPFENARRCGQGNQGMWSHHVLGGAATSVSQVYAYDFGLNEGEPILASRPGTVVDWFDWVPDDTDPDNPVPAGGPTAAGQTTQSRWNFIMIRHDLDEDDQGNLTPLANPNGDHDRGAGNALVWTYARYGHGRQGSVREMFTGNPIGQQVRRGQPIMRSGDTGTSFHNHVHMDVLPGPAPAPTPPGVTRAALGNQTIPFVFREVINPWVFPFSFPPDGVPQARTYYTSDNERPT